jgi:hypothetical protein
MHILNKMLKYDYILIYWLVVVKRTNIFQELIHADVKNMSVKEVMTTPEECICCVEVPTVHSQMLSEDMQCITDSDNFYFQLP